MSKKHSLIKSFGFAFQGIGVAFKNEPNFRIQIVIALIALISALILDFSALEMAILVLATGLVLILELINTTMEALVDLISEELQPKAKIAKDVSAAAVLSSAILAMVIGAFLFLPKILKLL